MILSLTYYNLFVIGPQAVWYFLEITEDDVLEPTPTRPRQDSDGKYTYFRGQSKHVVT